ncbi:hypothetical protein [Actinomadura sp. WMMB 499]|uniref:hypothetical protein n=1 Tax=Actinomadura sp. WMMB 499 TaxID=1219491 RepID=UPI001248C5BB|nr:hypothetical protein [Actinomadura sp. WMMB 499]QFG22077.1 hypothetical protein F7P10_14035 [Actinomadura sp. WMMB 499]
MRALTVWRQALVLSWRTWWGSSTAGRHLDALAAALRGMGYGCVLRARSPLLWVLVGGRVLAAIGVRATPGGTWGYVESGRHHLHPCGDAEAAAELVDRFLKHRMFPATW